ncbi:probable helicase MAGATAMA 3 [Prosopis cineraria]|uniref:probable helicase MAGATAMA 3 n=1 Tax=Prosopis cineraria TaxID=364024 RepID=UPI00240F6C9D|nr:probable helicase MAGATAMA 3 [Prosopis cineraria]
MALDREKLEEESVIRRFYQIILSWDYFRLLKESKKQKNNGGESRDGDALRLPKVKSQYKDVDEYVSTYEPLIFEEAKSQIIKQNEDEEVTEWKLGVVKSCTEADGFHFIELPCEIKEGESVSQNDLLLLSKEKFLDGKKFPTVYAFALVEHIRRFSEARLLRVRLYLAGEFSHFNTNDAKSCPRLLNMRSHISEAERQLYFLKICSLSTIAREYLAIRSINSLPYKDLILSAGRQHCGATDQSWKIPLPLKEYVESTFNQYQREAITAGLLPKAFVLIQGPPGTGKTQTILGLLSTILHAIPARVHSKSGTLELKRGPQLPIEEKYKHWGLASPWLTGINPRDSLMPKDGDDGFYPTTGNELKPEAVTSSRKYRVRVLVCAPSNSALDEIVLRVLNGGVHDESDRPYCPKVVRIGLKAHHSIKSVALDELVKQKRTTANKSSTDKQSSGPTGTDDDSIRAAILDEATIVFSTLSFSGSHVFSKLNRSFDVVIIDEAAQAVEPATLVPLANQCKKVFLVGDPAQLPATVISEVAKNHGYGKSLFERLKEGGYPVNMLKTQYRMHPEIRSFPSREFYEDSLEDGEDVKFRTEREWHDYCCFGPFCFFDIHEGQEARPAGSGSWINEEEVEFVLLLYQKLVTLYPVLKSGNQLAIISPYSQQVKLFQRRFEETFGVSSEKVVDICTIDGCQGREKDIAIFSCVRASKDKGIGFLEDDRRMNVGITRAKSAILVVGSASTLRRSERWNKLVESAEKRHSLLKVGKPYSSFFSDEKLKSMKAKITEALAPPQMVAAVDETDNNVPLDNAAADADQAQAEEQDYGDGDADMEYAGYDED